MHRVPIINFAILLHTTPERNIILLLISRLEVKMQHSKLNTYLWVQEPQSCHSNWMLCDGQFNMTITVF